jgi:predicted O-linked N-acetylglucosamine transferase (SPINDLY family)
MLMKSKALGDASVQESIRRQFAEFFVDPKRIEFEGFGSRAQVLAAYNQVDIGLDPFPFNGGLTTIESLWMGVPVVNLRGRRFAAHATETFLSAVGLNDWVVNSAEEYIKKVKEATDAPAQLAQLRGDLRRRVLGSPLFSHAPFVTDLEAAYRKAWEIRCGENS